MTTYAKIQYSGSKYMLLRFQSFFSQCFLVREQEIRSIDTSDILANVQMDEEKEKRGGNGEGIWS